jgi:hypothetical protein
MKQISRPELEDFVHHVINWCISEVYTINREGSAVENNSALSEQEKNAIKVKARLLLMSTYYLLEPARDLIDREYPEAKELLNWCKEIYEKAPLEIKAPLCKCRGCGPKIH